MSASNSNQCPSVTFPALRNFVKSTAGSRNIKLRSHPSTCFQFQVRLFSPPPPFFFHRTKVSGGTRGRLCENSESGFGNGHLIALHPSSKASLYGQIYFSRQSNQREDDSVHCWVSQRLRRAAEERKMKYLFLPKKKKYKEGAVRNAQYRGARRERRNK